jgi:ubiquinone/menaquinone biosynthesis C-methylase UbiE
MNNKNEQRINPWKYQADRYKNLYDAPGKPTSEEKKNFYKFIKDAVKKNKDVKALVLGATPAIRDELAKFDIETTLLDINEDMANAMNLLINHKKKEKFVKGNWIKMPFDNNTFDIVMGDLVLGNIESKYKNDFVKEISRILKPRGQLITRIFSVPKNFKKKSIEKICIKFSKMKDDNKIKTGFFAYLLYQHFDPITGDIPLSKIKKDLSNYLQKGKYIYKEDIRIEKLMNRTYEMWNPFKIVWHTGYKKDIFSYISKQFNIIDEIYAKDHYFGKEFPIIVCKKNNYFLRT